MNTLELRKRLLIAESEINRIQLTAEKNTLQSGLHTITHGVTAAGAMASSIVMLTTNLAAIPRAHQAIGTKPSRLQTILNGAVLISSIWLALLPRKT